MLLNRRLYDRMVFILLLLGRVGALVDISGNNENDLNLTCTNDYESLMSCQLNGQNCSEYSLKLKRIATNGELFESGFLHCAEGLCCCSFEMTLVMGETHSATVSRGGESLESKIISIQETIKPRAPTIVGVNKSNNIFEVFWRTNSKLDLTSEVTYYRKGGTERVSKLLNFPTVMNGNKYYEINGEDLIPNTAYGVRVRSYTNWSGMFSDRSEEWEFTTDPADPGDSTFMVIIISLSFAAVVLTGFIYACSIKFKTKIWDPAAKYPNPKILNISASKSEPWKPDQPIFSDLHVEPLIPTDSKPWSKMSMTDSSGGLQKSGSSSCLSYANAEPVNVVATVQDALCKAFPNISPVSMLTTSPVAELNGDRDLLSAPYKPCSSGSSGIDNKTYSIVIPMSQTEAEIPDLAYHSSETKNCPDLLVPLLQASPSMVSPVLTEMSYQQCNADSGRFSDAEESSLSSMSSGTNTTTSCDVESRTDAGCESSDEVLGDVTKLNSEKASTSVGNPGLSCVPAQRFLAVDDDYQAFQNLVEQPAVSLTEQENGGKHLDNYQEESSSKIPQFILSPVAPGFMNDVRSLSELQTPFFFMSKCAVDRSMPVITDSGYQSV